MMCLSRPFLLFVEDLHMLCDTFFLILKIIVENEDSKKNLREGSQNRQKAERISICVTGCILLTGFLKLPCSACNDISLLG